MKSNHKLALYVAYYLSRFDKEAVTNLGFSTFNEAINEISITPDVKRNTLKNWRDEFDPIHPHREGWHQRPMIASRVKVVQALENLDEPEIREIVNDILRQRDFEDSDNAIDLLNLVDENKKSSKKKKRKFVLRSPTGRQAEEFFVKYFNQNRFPVRGKLIDERDFGVGYDYKIKGINSSAFVEVKGMVDISGGILLTNKEWFTAKRKADAYYLVIIKALGKNPQVQIIQNPVSKLQAKKSIYATVQVSWSITDKQLSLLSE
jgi:hypothetical protein